MSGEPKWTPAQWAAITGTDGALLVSAAAGSGKTAVLAARCVHLVCTASPACDVDQLLVLTFTRAAAGEMRERIEGALRRQIEAQGNPELERQLRLLDRASITTLDSFCAALVRANFHLLGIDPGFGILAPEDAALLRTEVADRLLDGEYESPRADALKVLLDSYFGGDDARLRAELMAAHALMQSTVDPDTWATRAIARLEGGANGQDTELLTRFSESQQRLLRGVARQLDAARQIAREANGLEKYIGHVDEVRLEVDLWSKLAAELDLSALAVRAESFKLPRLPTVKGDIAGKEAVRVLIDEAKGALKGKGGVFQACRWTIAQLRDDLARIVPHARCFIHLAQRFTAAYDAAKRDLRALDFADIERLALRVLREEGTTLQRSASAQLLQARFHHVLVDEYQDINPLQNAILRLISRDIVAETDTNTRSNFFAVGDVKQSIYRFRLAEPQQFVDRQLMLREEGSVGRVIDLQENFRSRGPLLDAVNDVFRLLMTEESTGIAYDATHELRSIVPYPDLGEKAFTGKPIEFHLLPGDVTFDEDTCEDDDAADAFEREISLVATRIRELIDEQRVVAAKQDGKLVARPIAYGDIAVLLRSAKFKSSVVADELRGRGIPVHAEDSTGFFANTEVQDVLTVLRLITNLEQDIPMAAFIRSPFARIASPEDALATVRLAYPEEPFARAVQRYAEEAGDTLAEQLQPLLQQLRTWRNRFRGQSIGESLAAVLEESGYLIFCRALPDGRQREANLRELLDRASMFDTFERQGLDRFLLFLQELEEDDQLGRPSVAAASSDHVHVMTVHKSKGLEFPVVIVPDLGKRFNERSLSAPILLDRDLGIGMAAVDLPARVRYPSLASMVIKSHQRRQAVAEEVRVLYVALTRAREHLILIGSSKSRFDTLAARWKDHVGPLPDEVIQSARTALDWIVPIVAITEKARLGTFAVTDWHDTPPPDDDPRAREESAQQKLKRWLDAARVSTAQPSSSARGAIEQLRFLYPHTPATIVPSTSRVTDQIEDAAGEAAPHAVELEWPATYRPSKRASAVDVGSATHRFMELLDFHAASSRAEIEDQLQGMVAQRQIQEREARLIDLEAAEWFAQSELGALMRAATTRTFRERSLAYSTSVEGLAESDCALVRGRVDALLATAGGLVLIDYKTDRVEPLFVAARAQTYWPQLRGYASAVERITRMPVTRACLVFLNARQILDLPATDVGGA